MKKATLLLSDGSLFEGCAFSGEGERIGEIVFNTAMTGYQEILTDPSYKGQLVVMTYPLIGNYGINPEDMESRHIFLESMIVKEYIAHASNWRSTKSLQTYLNEHNILGVTGFDTRAITKKIRDAGALKAILTTLDEPVEVMMKKIQSSPDMNGADLTPSVTCDKPYSWKAPDKHSFKVAVLDCGVKYNILEQLRAQGISSDVFPVSTSADTILKGNYDGLFISNGPGDPAPVLNAVDIIQKCLGQLPIFGICLGHQILSIALGAKTFKLKFGHHGANHPIMNLRTKQVEITSQNHGFAVDPASIDPQQIEVTHINLNDQTIAGIKHPKLDAFSVQYHPEAAPGPHDSQYLFDEFVLLMEKKKHAKTHWY